MQRIDVDSKTREDDTNVKRVEAMKLARRSDGTHIADEIDHGRGSGKDNDDDGSGC